MARLRILELPEGAGDERPPFAVVIDQIGMGADADALRSDLDETGVAAERLGARCILGFTDAIDLPGDELVDPRIPQVMAAVREALGIDMSKAPSDISGVLLAACRELTNSEAARDHLRQESENLRGRSEALEQRIREVKAGYRDALGLDNDEAIDSLAAARDMRRELDQSREAIRSVLHAHRGEGHQGRVICVECSALDDQGTTDNPTAAYPCDTVKRISEAFGEAGAPEIPEVG